MDETIAVGNNSLASQIASQIPGNAGNGQESAGLENPVAGDSEKDPVLEGAPDADRVLNLVRSEAIARKKEIEAKKKIDELQQNYESTKKEYDDFLEQQKQDRELAKKDPFGFLAKYDLTMDGLISREVEGGDEAKEHKPAYVLELERKLSEFSQREKDREEQARKAQEENKEKAEQERQAREQQYVDDYKSEINKNITETDDFPYLKASQNYELVFQVAEQRLMDTNGKQLLSPKEAAQEVEKYLAERYREAGLGGSTGYGRKDPEQSRHSLTKTLSQQNSGPAGANSPVVTPRNQYDDIYDEKEAMRRAQEKLRWDSD